MAKAEPKPPPDSESDPEPESSPEPQSGAGPEDWRDGIEDGKIREFAGRFNTPADIAKTAFEFRQKLSNAIAVPGRNASQEEIAEYLRKLGVPDSADGYGIEAPENLPEHLRHGEADAARQKNFLAAMHKAGATSPVVQAAMDWYYAELAALDRAHAAALKEAAEVSAAELRKEWGNDYERNVEFSRRAAREFGGDRFAGFLEKAQIDGTTLGDHPEFIRAFAVIGRRMGEDGLHLGPPEGGAKTTQERIDEIHSWQFSDDPVKREKYRTDTAQKELSGLYEKLVGTGPVVGQGGRTV